ncbi:MAG: hemolysin family protein [Candidatus Puniceispirillaceae bacterium]
MFQQLSKLFPFMNRSVSDREELTDLIETSIKQTVAFDNHESALLQNMLGLRDITAEDVMVPRADIKAVDLSVPAHENFQKIVSSQHSRVPAFQGSMDKIVGFLHLKDLMARTATGEFQADKAYDLTPLLRPVLFVSPSIRLLDLLHEMRLKRQHLALVVDEFGGVDGLITIEDLVEEIVGEIEDEHDQTTLPQFQVFDDGTAIAEARLEIGALEILTGPLLDEDDEDEIETVGGLVLSIAGQVPSRGEVITHPTGIEFEVIEADPRQIKKVRICGLTSFNGGVSSQEIDKAPG